MQYHYQWSALKDFGNQRKHSVSFKFATAVFSDPMALSIFDEENSHNGEDRWITMGLVNGYSYLVVVHTWLDANANSVTIRIISARKATKSEIRQYLEG